MTEIKSDYFPSKEETEEIINLGFEVYNHLGFGFLEIVYKDALEYEFNRNKYLFEREREYPVHYKDSILKHRFWADFVLFDSVILEVKAKEGIAAEDMAQIINYLKCSNCQVGLILNFARKGLQIKRVVF
ncbi:MAG: GxxExxY protein [Bacteroidetes bacterium]|nr:MAG: GxxExxY protein [Bacteroidota bacterium]